jgi:peptidoglycan/LPS O-acetylase OafA/YrhL
MTFCVLTALTALGAWCYMRLGYHVLAAEQRFPQSPDFWYRIGRYVVADPRNLWSDFRFLWLVFLSIMGLGALLRFWHDGKAGKFDKFFILSAVGCWSIFCIVVPLERHIRGVMSLGDVSTYLSHGVPVVAFFILSCFWKMHSRILSYLGLISYSLYLFHLTLIVPLGYFLKQHPQSVPRSTPDSLLVIAAVFLSIGAAAVIFVLIEKPAIDLSHRLANIQVGEPAHEA